LLENHGNHGQWVSEWEEGQQGEPFGSGGQHNGTDPSDHEQAQGREKDQGRALREIIHPLLNIKSHILMIIRLLRRDRKPKGWELLS